MKILTTVFLTLSLAGGVLAQGTTTTTPSTLMGGDVDNGFLFAPDFKFTDVDGDFATLLGGYGGWVLNQRFLVGAGIYTLANGGSSTDMTYGGGVFEYFLNQDSLVNVSVRSLVGGGSATLGSRFPGFDRDFPGGRRGSDAFRRLPSLDRLGSPFGVNLDDLDLDDGGFFDRSTSFFVAEPEVNVMINISERLRVNVGGGYRFIGGASRFTDRLDGFTASAALKFSFF